MPNPLVHVVGYSKPLVVSSKHIGRWTAANVDATGDVVKVFPRRWSDIWGRRSLEIWESALRAVVSELLARPGIPQFSLRRQLKFVYDRQELVEVLTYLHANGYACYRTEGLMYPCFESLTVDEERGVFWFVREGTHWYNL